MSVSKAPKYDPVYRLYPGTSCDARFVGDFADSESAHAAVAEAGDIATYRLDGKRRVAIRCAICLSINDLSLKPDSATGWTLTSTDPPHLEPSVKSTLPYPDKTYICHYFIHRGRFEALADSTPGGITAMYDD